MVDIKQLLPELKKQVTLLAEDLLKRVNADAKINDGLKDAFQQIEKGGRTAQAYEVWLEDYLDQVAVAWVLACVFVRFLEDNGLIDECWLAGEGERRQQAEDTLTLYFREHKNAEYRDYFQHVFQEVGKIPAAVDLFAEGKTPLWAVAPSGDAAMNLLKFWREQVEDMDHPPLKRSFKVEDGDTRFLGDLYQELSERAKKKFALLQTPVFVEEFILDRTLTPALAEFGLEKVRMIDPTCGSGHFLLGGFARLFDLWSKQESNEIKAAQNALNGVWGVDINPFAVAIARFRLIVAAVQACGIERLKHAPGWKIHLATGDSLLFGSRWNQDGTKRAETRFLDESWVPEIYACEDKELVREILGQQYHAVVGNPPYIVVRDSKLNEAYRERFPKVCYRQYSLGVPFTQRFWELALRQDEPGASVDNALDRPLPNGRGSLLVEPRLLPVEPRPSGSGESRHEPRPSGSGSGRKACGYVGMITANSFMKREFGKKLIEEFFPKIDLTHLIDTSGAYIPGHGTPTVILLGRNRQPVGNTVRAVLGIKGEPTTPANASQGLVWQSIVKQIDIANAQDDYISTADAPRETFASHPWSIGGGGAADLRDRLDTENDSNLKSLGCDLGFLVITGEDNCLVLEKEIPRRIGLKHVMPLILGDGVRDWSRSSEIVCLWPNDSAGNVLSMSAIGDHLRYCWPFRSTLRNRKAFGVPVEEKGIAWWALREVYAQRLQSPLSIVFAFVATHNHFVLDRGGKVFNRSAPIIKLPPMIQEPRPSGSGISEPLPHGRGSNSDVEPRPLGSGGADPLPDGRGSRPVTEDDYLELLGLLNSSTACFWMKQNFQTKGSSGIGRGIYDEKWESFYEHTGTGLERFPVPDEKPLVLATELDKLARECVELLPDNIVAHTTPTAERLAEARTRAATIRTQMIALQEELDWQCYRLYGLIAEDLTDVISSRNGRSSRSASSSRDESSSRDREGAVCLGTKDDDHRSLTVAAPEAIPEAIAAPGPVVLDEDWKGACRTVSKAEIEPQPYFVTFTCYGTWLHGDERGSIDRDHNEWQTPPLEPDEERERREFALLKHSPVKLGPKQRTIVHRAIEEVCQHRGWRLHALNVRTNHVHVVVTANRRGKRVYNDFKSYATRRMKEAGCLPEACLEVFEKDRFLTGAAPTATSSRDRQGAETADTEPKFKVWTRGGSARPIDTENSFRRAIEYTLREQGPDITPGVSMDDRFLTGAAPTAGSSRDREGAGDLPATSRGEVRFLTGAALALRFGERAFEIVMARQMAKGELETTWFDRHGSTPIAEIPSDWPASYRELVERRIKLIETNKEIALIEKPEYKRRWNTEPWEQQEQRALKNWLLDRLETPKYPKGTKDHPELTTTAQITDVASTDAEFLQVAALYRGRTDFDLAALVAELVEGEAVPWLPILRYKPPGLRKRELWERTWELQREEDRSSFQCSVFSVQQEDGNSLKTEPPKTEPPKTESLKTESLKTENFPAIPVPPKYISADFLKTDYWRLRGKLDVPKERWVSYPHCSTDSDPTLVVGWAGWNHLEQATALVAYYDARKREGWSAERLTPLLAGLDQLIPWIQQWHREVDPEYGDTAGQSFQHMLESDAHELGLTLEVIRNWTPPEKVSKARAGRKKKGE